MSSTDYDLTLRARSRARSLVARLCGASGLGLLAATVLVIVPVVGSHPSGVAAAAGNPVLVVGGDISCSVSDGDFGGSNPSDCQQRATANLIHSIGPNYLLPGGDTQYAVSQVEGGQPTAADYSGGYGGSWGQLQNPTSSNYVPGLVVRPTPGDNEYGDANETDSGAVGNASNYYSYFSSQGDLPAGVTGPSSDFYSFDIPVTGGTWHIVSLDGECAALPATSGGAPSQSAAGCASGSPEETFLRNDLAAHQGDCILLHFHQPEFSEGFGTDTDYQTLWSDAVQYHVTAIINGHAHSYERFRPLDQNGTPDAAGPTEIVVGTGGNSLGSDVIPNSNVVASDFSDFGVLKMTLNSTNAAFAFDTVSSGTQDSGTINCQQSTGANAPTVTGVSPSTGSTAGGTSVTISGTNFTGTSAVQFGSVAATTFKVNSTTSITATSPAGAAGAVDVSVTTPSGTSATGPPDQFTYTTPPGAITTVGSSTSATGSGITTLAVSPQAAGDVLAVFAKAGAAGPTVTSVSGGGVSTWTKAAQFNGSIGGDEELWYGKVTTTGASTVTFNWSSSVAADSNEYGAQEFSAGLGASTVWATDKTGTLNGASSTSVPYPTLTPSASGELYFGYSLVANTAAAGTTSGFTYAVTAEANAVTYDTNVSGAVTPVATQSPAGTSSAVGVLLSASTGAPPTVTGLSPSTGTTAGGTSVTISGTNFTGASAVKFGTVAATSFTVNNVGSITAVSPAEGAATVDVTVTVGANTSAISQPADQFAYSAPPPPTVTGLSPSTGTTAGGTSVTISGTNFTGASAVKFGTVAATSFTVNNVGSITAVSPAEGAATVDVTVTVGANTSAISQPADQFAYSAPPPPTVTGVSPSTGTTAGGTSVTISGTNFTGASAVKFGTVAATSFTVNNVGSITAVSPAEGAATVDVTVTVGANTSAISRPSDQFTYSVPATAITAVGTLASAQGSALTTLAVSPKTAGDVLTVFAQVSSASGTTVSSVSGGGVTTWTKAVQFNGSVGADAEIWYGKVTTTGASTITFNWSGSITGHIAEYGAQEFSAGLGASTVWATDKTGTLNGASSTSVPFPSLTPSASGELYFGYTVVANTAAAGTTSGFTYAVTAEANAVTYDTNVSGAVTPVATQSPAGTSSAVGVLLSASTGAPPTVTGLSPSTGTTAGGTSVTISGTNFTGASAVKFGTVAATSFTVNNVGSITAVSPAEGAATVDVTVTVGANTSAISQPADQFAYSAPPPPTVTGVSPSTGTTAGGTSVTISGTNFTGASAVKFGTVAATSFTVNNVGSITAVSPAEGAATVDVTVTVGANTSAISQPADQFAYSAPPPPTVTGLSPSTGTTAGGTSVTISGTNFTGASAVKFGTVAATSFTVNNVGSITAVSPAEGAATVDVTVTVGANTSAISQPADQFAYSAPPPPTVTGVSPSTGTTAGGTSVTISGTNFTGASAVKFGTVAATSFIVNNVGSITAVSPAEGAATVDVTVTVGANTSAISRPADQFTYSVPATAITAVGTLASAQGSALTTLAVSPKTAGDVLTVFAQVSSASGTTVSSVSGGGVTTWTKAVQFNGSVGADAEIWYGKVTTTGASTITFNWSGSITGHIAEYGAQEFSAGLGASTVWATDKTGTLNGASSTSVPFPSLTPSASGELYFGYTVVANTAAAGTTSGFTYAVTAEANAVTYDTNVSGAVTPVATQSPAGTSSAVGVLLSASTGAPPTVTGVSPSTGTTAGGTSVTISGTNFTGASAVKFGTVAATSFTVNNVGSITAVSPAEGAATVDVTVTVGANTSAISQPADQFAYSAPPPPTVTGVSPSTGTTAGGTSVTISGTNFTGASAVKFGTVAATSFTVNNVGSITAVSPAEGAATVDVTVTVGANTSAISQPADQFAYSAPPPPTVTGVSPSTGTTAGGTSVTISGTNFTGASAVKFGTVAATSFIVNNVGSITAVSPAEGAATVDVTVTVGANTSAISRPSDQFTYSVPATAITAVGTLASAQGSALTTLAVSPKTAGDVLTVFAQVSSASGTTVSSVSGGGVTTWTKAVQFNGSVGADAEIWYGKVTTTGASTITFNWSGSITGHIAEYGAQEFSAGLGASTVWATDKTGTLNGASSTSVPFPSLTPSASGELYFGYTVVANTAAAGTTSGFTYAVTAEANAVTYDTNVSGAVTPVATQSPAGTSSAVGVLLSASP